MKANTALTPDTNDERVFTVVTHAPIGTLGDVSWAKKYIENTLENYKKENPTKRVRFNLVVTGVNDDAQARRIKATLGEKSPFRVIYETGNHKDFFNRPDLKSDAFIFYAFQFTSDTHIQTIKDLKTPMFVVNHYNFDASTDNRYEQKKTQWMASLYTGFGENSLGVNVDDLENKSQNISVPSADLGVYRLVFNMHDTTVLTTENIQQYSEQNALFFGYVNKCKSSESPRNFAKPTEYITSCIAKSKRQHPHKNIDIVIRLNEPGSLWTESYWSECHHYAQVTEHFKKNHTGLSVSIYKKDASGTLVLKERFGTGETPVRIIDPFPINQTSMINLMQYSDPFCLMTGCESFIESLSCNKLPLYQMVHWHERLYNELLKEIEHMDGLGKGALLYQYFALQDKSKNTTYTQLEDFICQNESELLKQITLFKQHLLDHKQLKSTLSKKIESMLINKEEYIHQCLDEDNILYFDDEPELTTRIGNLPSSIVQLYAMHPDLEDTICQDAARLLTNIAEHSKYGEKGLSSFLEGCKRFEDNSSACKLLTRVLSQVVHPEVKKRILIEEWSLFSSQLLHAEASIKRNYSSDSKRYKDTMSVINIIKQANENAILSLLAATNQQEHSKALNEFYAVIKEPLKNLEECFEKKLLNKIIDCFFKIICAIFGFPVILIMASTEKNREHLRSFFFSSDGCLENALPSVVKNEQQSTIIADQGCPI